MAYYYGRLHSEDSPFLTLLLMLPGCLFDDEEEVIKFNDRAWKEVRLTDSLWKMQTGPCGALMTKKAKS